MTNSHTVSFRYSKEDVLNYVVETLGLARVKCTLMFLLIVTLLVLAIILYCMNLKILSVILLLVALFTVPATLFLMYLNVASTLSYLTDCVFTTEDDKLIIASNLGVETYLIKDLNNIVVTDTFILIYISKKVAFGVPIRAFSDRDKARAFISNLRLHHV